MSGTVAGGKKAAATNMKKYGKDFYKKNGKKGGQNGHTGGFYANHELARIAGAKGGKKSRRGPAKKKAKIASIDSNVNVEPVGVVRELQHYDAKKPGILSRLFGRKNG